MIQMQQVLVIQTQQVLVIQKKKVPKCSQTSLTVPERFQKNLWKQKQMERGLDCSQTCSSKGLACQTVHLMEPLSQTLEREHFQMLKRARRM